MANLSRFYVRPFWAPLFDILERGAYVIYSLHCILLCEA